MSASYSQTTSTKALEADRDSLSPLESAIVKTVAYTDVFDFPLTLHEIFRYLIRVRGSETEIAAALGSGKIIPKYLSNVDEYYTLPGREKIVELRKNRAEIGKQLLPVALKFGRQISGFPFIKMVALTGALAANNADAHGDLDYFIVTESGRLWLTRGMILLLVKVLERKNIILCPNYLVTENALELKARNLFTARELAQMIPISGMEIYTKMRTLNRWTDEYLPNAVGPPISPEGKSSRQQFARKSVETLLRTPPGGAIERWEMNRKIRKFNQTFPETDETNFSADCCQGHFDGYGKRTMDAYHKRLTELEISP